MFMSGNRVFTVSPINRQITLQSEIVETTFLVSRLSDAILGIQKSFPLSLLYTRLLNWP